MSEPAFKNLITSACRDLNTYSKVAQDGFELAGVDGLTEIYGHIEESLKNKKTEEFACLGFDGLVRSGPFAYPGALKVLPQIVLSLASKDKNVREAADSGIQGLLTNVTPFALPQLLPILEKALHTTSKPTQKEYALKYLEGLAERHPKTIARQLVRLVPLVSDLLNDIKKEVAKQACKSLQALVKTNGNRDLEPFLEYVVQAVRQADKVAECVENLAGCIFVQNVEAPHLAVTTPVLQRGLNHKSSEVKRKCCVIIDNMCKLVEDPNECAPLLPRLEPLTARVAETLSDPEARSVAEKSLVTLKKSASGVRQLDLSSTTEKPLNDLNEEFKKFVTGCCLALVEEKNFDRKVWFGTLNPFLRSFISKESSENVCEELVLKLESALKPEEVEDEIDDDGEDLYKGSFSLAYGTLTLLRDTKMHLKKHKFYGLLGANNCGKTTLMRAITREQIEGFPTRDELATIFVEHELEEKEVSPGVLTIDLSGIDWVVYTVNEDYKAAKKTTKEEVLKGMLETGFGKDRAADPDANITTYSGGWKMKLQLVAAALMNADILMLDEPTGHLDVSNIAWLQSWLLDFPGSIICTSHDTKFLNAMCTHVIDFEDRKLRIFKGNQNRGDTLKLYVDKYPEKHKYFALKNDVMKFSFPNPGALEGVKSKTKAILKMTNVTFAYVPGKIIVDQISLQCSMASRVSVVGNNGAGKSTAIKILYNELKQDSGTVYRHPNLRIAYVAQHAFQHLEQHLGKTPVQYIMWRFAGNDDKESVEFRTKEISVDEEKARDLSWCIDQMTGDIRPVDPEKKNDKNYIVKPDSVLGRRKNAKQKRDEYEIKWLGKTIYDTNWVPRDTLIKMGYIKLVQREDEKQAQMAGLQSKPLTQPGVERHLRDFGIDAETASHTQIHSLSGGQKVKVVLAASMWQNPHLVILDEPTNYLDRDGLGALTHAINDFEGGIIVISHNREFADSVATEKWIMENGKLRMEGDSVAKEEVRSGGEAKTNDVYDQFGNLIDVRLQRDKSDKEKKKEIKDIEKKLRDHKKKKYLTEDDYWELQDQLELLRNEVKR